MSAPAVQTQNEAGESRQRFFQLKEEFAMMMATGSKNVRVWISENLRTRLGAKVLRGLALVAPLAAGTTMYISMSQGEAGSPSVIGETTQAFQPPAHPDSGDLSEGSFRIREEQRAADRRDDLRDMTQYWDQLKRDATSGSTSYYDEDVEERVYDELRMSFFGIPNSDSSLEDLEVDSAWHPFGSLLPDTEYYRDPDWNERQMRSSSK